MSILRSMLGPLFMEAPIISHIVIYIWAAGASLGTGVLSKLGGSWRPPSSDLYPQAEPRLSHHPGELADWTGATWCCGCMAFNAEKKSNLSLHHPKRKAQQRATLRVLGLPTWRSMGSQKQSAEQQKKLFQLYYSSLTYYYTGVDTWT